MNQLASGPDISGYNYQDAETNVSHEYLLPMVVRILDSLHLPQEQRRLFDLGCGNGSVARILVDRGWNVTGVDPSHEGIARAKQAYPELNLYQGSAYDNLAARFGQFPVVLSLEVVEHVYSPRVYARTLFDLVTPGGVAVISTPYHGYLKNLAIAVTGKMDRHFTALWDHGHIKFWSVKTLRGLLLEAGFSDLEFARVGRIRMLAKSMIAVAGRKIVGALRAR